ncbi:MAG: PQQ-binding-like beta-propeller repeat protein, partial [Planctomycetota bacterium]|nr:PQQ-binding-like beta-propeller repeat protein [Planctomycetota bacterium]
FGTYGTACLDTNNGETIWERRDIHCDHMEGPGSSPVLWRDLLIVHMDGGDVQYVIALDKKTGKTRWKRPRSTRFRENHIADQRKAYSTPIVIDVAGNPTLISSGAVETAAYDPATGKEVWKVRTGGFSMSSRPVAGNGLVFLNSGFMRPQLFAVRPGGSGDVTDDAIVWSYKRNVPTMPSPLFVDGHVYMVNDSGIASCLDAKTGERVWHKRIDGRHCASPIYAAGRLYFFDRDGGTTVLAAGKEPKELAVNRLDDGFMASAAVVGDAFILRTRTHLYRVERE